MERQYKESKQQTETEAKVFVKRIVACDYFIELIEIVSIIDYHQKLFGQYNYDDYPAGTQIVRMFRDLEDYFYQPQKPNPKNDRKAKK
ncbi:MAG: hypothetical protein EOO43_24890 [Flavobacterium sp.]|nr:MAG: hypothetical protein EOO43_24890 [Flavobacterium sp.]